MRRKYFGLAMAAVATLGPAQAFGGDREIAQSIIERLKVSRDAGELKGFSLDMKVDEGTVLFRGQVSGDQQRAIVLATSEGIDGIESVVDELEVTPGPLATSQTAKILKPKTAAMAVSSPQSETEASRNKGGKFDFAGALAPPAEQEHGPAMPLPTETAPTQRQPGEALADESNASEQSSSVVQLIEEVPAESNRAEALPSAESKVVDASAEPSPAAHPVQDVVPGIVLPAAAYEGEQLAMPIPAPVEMESGAADHSTDNQGKHALTPVTEDSGVVTHRVDDEKMARAVARAIGRAQSEGYLKNFAVDVQSYDGVIELKGNAASQQQSEFLETIARHAPGAREVRNQIEVSGKQPNSARPSIPATPVAHRSGSPLVDPSSSGLQPLPAGNRKATSPMPAIAQAPQMQPQMQRRAAQQMPRHLPSQMQSRMQRPMPQHRMPPMRRGGVPARMTGYNQPYGGQQTINGERVVPGSVVNQGAHAGASGGPANGPVAGGGAPMMGQPVPMAPAAPAGAPRYDSPNLPNYAWPGYAAHPNYAALSYPQQYSPSAFPFIGPFYPYPQVPLGWRKVSLEWDDGWWFLDFTDK